MKRFALLILALIFAIFIGQKFNLTPANLKTAPEKPTNTRYEVVSEESIITKVVAESLASVVTIGINATITRADTIRINPFNKTNLIEKIPGTSQKVEKNIASGFIIDKSGLIITNKHVVADTTLDYQVITSDDQKYKVEKIYRDPLNDLAILKISPSPSHPLKPLKLGNSRDLKLGQLVIAIGTPLGEFTNTVTTGIVSGLGRGITAGSPYQSFVEKLDNVIQTDAAINPGNSGGPLLDSKGQVIGINTAVSELGQNIAFAIPVDLIKTLITNFNNNGGVFSHPFVGVRYRMVDSQTAVLDNTAAGAYVVEVIKDSPAYKSGIQEGDTIIEFDNQKIKGENDQELTRLIANKKIGQTITVKIVRNKQTKALQITLESTNK